MSSYGGNIDQIGDGPGHVSDNARCWWAWCFNIEEWSPCEKEFDRLLKLVQVEEQKRISRFRFMVDQKRALVGRLLIRRLIMEAFDVRDSSSIRLGRTETGKPFLVKPEPKNFHFNISHHGHWVVIVGHRHCLVGVDVMEYEFPKGNKSVDDFFTTMRSSFTPREWKFIRYGQNEPKNTSDLEQLQRFYKFWSLKESYIKALGVGVGFGLQRASFELLGNESARLYVDNIPVDKYGFSIQPLDDDHCVAIALELPAKEEAHTEIPLKFERLFHIEL